MQFPTEFIQASSCLITSKTHTELTEYGMNTQVGKRGNPHKWMIDFATRKLDHIKTRGLQAFLDSLDGRYTTFTLPVPLPFLGGTETFTANGSASVGSDAINVNNLPSSKTDALMAGDYINFDNHDKTYKIVSNSTTDGSGNTVMNIYPKLRVAVGDGDGVSKGVMTLRMMKDTSALRIKGSTTHNIIKISAQEV